MSTLLVAMSAKKNAGAIRSAAAIAEAIHESLSEVDVDGSTYTITLDAYQPPILPKQREFKDALREAGITDTKVLGTTQEAVWKILKARGLTAK